MRKIRIHDLNNRSLAFDLRDLLRILGSRSQTATWTVMKPDAWTFEATGEGGLRLEQLAEVSGTLSGDELLAIADDTVQVIWGDFIGTLSDDPHRHWLTIRAIDSSFYEVETSDETSIVLIKSHFRDVRILDEIK